MTRTTFLAIAAALFAGCEVDEAFVPGGGSGGGFRIAWPSTTATVEDAQTFAIAIFPFAGTEQVTFTAELDNSGTTIGGLRNESDSVVAFPLSGLTDGSHLITVRASTGDVRNRTFNVNIVSRPTITNVDPDSARLGTNQQITITGTGFLTSSAQMRVYLNGVALPIAGTPTTTEVRATVLGDGLRSGLLSVATVPSASGRRISRELVPFRVPDGSSTLPGQAEILLADPNAAPRNAPVLLYGKGFAAGDVPRFGTFPSGPILITGSESLPNTVGLVQFGLTIVPGLAPSQDNVVTIEAGGTTSTSFPFFIR